MGRSGKNIPLFLFFHQTGSNIVQCAEHSLLFSNNVALTEPLFTKGGFLVE